VDKHGVGSEYRWLNEQRCVAPVPCTCEESDDEAVEPVAGGELTALAEAETAVEAGWKKSLGPVGVAVYKRLGLLPDCDAALVAMDTVEAAGAAVEAAVECGSEAAVEAAAEEELASEDYYYDDASSPGLDDSDTNLFTVIEAKYGWKNMEKLTLVESSRRISEVSEAEMSGIFPRGWMLVLRSMSLSSWMRIRRMGRFSVLSVSMIIMGISSPGSC